MSNKRIPPNRDWRGHYPGNFAGSLWSSWNIDLERVPGRLALANRMTAFKTGVGVPWKFIRTNATTTDEWFAIVHGADILRNGNSTFTGGTWATDDTTGTFNDPRDMVVHESANGEQRLLCTRATDIAILNSSGSANVWDDDWWSAVLSQAALTSLTYHPLAKLQRLVAVGDKVSSVPVIHTIDKDDVVSSSRLTFAAEYTIRCIYTSSNRFWIALQHDYGGNAKIVEWDGFSLTYNNEYELEGSYPLVGFVVRDVPYFVTEKGIVHRFNGAGFEAVQDFGLREQNVLFNTGITNNATIQPTGAWVEGHLVYINVGYPAIFEPGAAQIFGGASRGRSGIWVFNTRNLNLYHHMGLGDFIDGGNDDNFGCGYLNQPGTVLVYDGGGEKLLGASASFFTGGTNWNTSSTDAFFREAPLRTTRLNRGFFVTPYIPADEVQDEWKKIWLKFRKFISSSNRLIVKWRVVDPPWNQDDTNNRYYTPLQAQATWASTTTFTAVVPTGVAVGDEVEVLTGDNAGCCFDISALSGTPNGSSSLTVTISEAAPKSSTDKALVRFDNWDSETAISDTSVKSASVPLMSTAQGTFIQLKVEMRGIAVEVDELIPVYNKHIDPEQ